MSFSLETMLLACEFGVAAAVRDSAARRCPGYASTGRDRHATPLPEITVTAPSPIVRRKLVPSPRNLYGSRTPFRAAIASRPRSRNPRRCRHAPTRRASRRDRSVCDGHRGAERGNPPAGRRDARRPAVFQARHYRFRVCARRFQPSDHPRSRCQSRRDYRERNWQQRRIGSRRRSLRADRSTCRPTRSKSFADPRPCATGPRRSAAWSAPPITAFRTHCRPALRRRFRPMGFR